MITSTPATKQQRLAALEAGAWDYLSLVLNGEELALKLDAFTRVKLETDHALDEGAVEPASGLYTMRGLERRARELVSDAFRRHAPLACVALAVELVPQDANPADWRRHPWRSRTRARPSGARAYVRRDRPAGRSEFAVLAPSTAPEGAALMARRLTQALETAGPDPPACRRCWSGPATRPSRTCTPRRSRPTASWSTPERRWSRLAPRETLSVSEPTRVDYRLHEQLR